MWGVIGAAIVSILVFLAIINERNVQAAEPGWTMKQLPDGETQWRLEAAGQRYTVQGSGGNWQVAIWDGPSVTILPERYATANAGKAEVERRIRGGG